MSDLPKYVGPFEVRDRLGHGGMGMVYLAYDPMLDRSVAVKVLRVPDEETRRRFLREARLHAKVQHPHIVSIYAVGEHEGQPYLAMEYIAGSTLAAIVRSGDDVPLARKVTWLAELSAGLDHAHRYGIIHRDVKPSNILITRETGRLRLLDFGIAHGQEAMGMTMAGMVIGTPQYMSPEQITGKAVDARSDIFSVGLVGYELLTGQQAFGGDNVFDISRRIVGEPPAPLAAACRSAPTSLVRIIEKCIAKAPEDRYQEARQLERELLSVARRLDPEHTLISMPQTAPTAVIENPGETGDDPSTAAATMAARVRDAVSAGRLAEAEQLLRDLQTRHTRTPGLSGLRVLVEEARQFSHAVNLAGDAERALSRLNLTEAQALIDDIERVAPSWTGLAPLRRQLQTLQNERRVNDVAQRISASLDAGSLDEAEPALRDLAALAPDHPDLAALRSRYHTKIAHHQAATLASRARVSLQQDQLDDAAALVAEALAIAPGNEDALSVQELVGQRRRAQRLARAAQKVSAALDAGQPVSARKAFDQLQRMDATHPDLDGLRKRVERLERGEEPDTTSAPGAVARALAPTTPAVAAVGAVAPAVPARDVAETPRAFDTLDDDDLHLSRPDLPLVGAAHDETPVPAGRPGWIVPLVAIALMAALGLGYYVLRPALPADEAQVATSNATGQAAATTADAAAETGLPEGDPATDAASDTPDAPPPPPVTDERAPDRAPTPRADAATALRRVQQLGAEGRYTDAFVALGQIPGLSRTAVEAEERRLTESARERAEVARRTASDFRAGTTDAFIQGGSRQQLGNEHFKAGRMRPATAEFVRARDAFELALSTRTAGTDTPTPPGPGGDVSPTPAPPAVVATMTPWTNDQVMAVVRQYRTLYEQRNISGIQRLWPAMDPASERRLRGTFGIPGELQWIPLGQKVIRQPDKATFTAAVMNVTPVPEGGTPVRREVQVSIDIAPQGDRLVIAAFKQQ